MKFGIALLALLLVACAGQQNRPYGQESNARESARIHTELGAGYYAQNQVKIALEEFTLATKIDPGYSMAYNGLGLVYGALGEDTKAESNFRRAIQLEPTNSESRNNYGSFLCSRERVDESIVQFMEAVKNPLYATPGVAYMNAGICAMKKQNYDSAQLYLQKALQVQPLLYQASYQLARIHFERAQYSQARQYLVDGLRVYTTPEMLWLAVRVERLLGDRNAEASYALQLRQNYPNSEQTKALMSGR